MMVYYYSLPATDIAARLKKEASTNNTHNGDRTRGHSLKRRTLYRLSYVGKGCFSPPLIVSMSTKQSIFE